MTINEVEFMVCLFLCFRRAIDIVIMGCNGQEIERWKMGLNFVFNRNGNVVRVEGIARGGTLSDGEV